MLRSEWKIPGLWVQICEAVIVHLKGNNSTIDCGENESPSPVCVKRFG